MAASKAPGFFAQLRQASKQWHYNASGYCKYGLLRDDLVNETPEVVEALRRLPQQIKDVRTFRIMRAVQCSIRHDYLPQKEWTKFEDDVPYLQPYLEEVHKEKAERHEWNSK